MPQQENKSGQGNTGKDITKLFSDMAEGVKGQAEGKAREYADRIKNGEDKEKIFEGLSPSFVKKVEEILKEEEENSLKEPANYEEYKKIKDKKERAILEKDSEKLLNAIYEHDKKNTASEKNALTNLEKDKIKEDAKKEALENFNKQRATIVNIDEIAEAEAHKAADAHMTMSKESQKGVKGFLTRLWKHTFFDEYYRQKEMNKVREEITNTDNIYAGRIKDTNRLAHKNAMQGISERFASEYDGMIREGEEKEVLDSKDPATINAITDIKNLIAEYAKGNINDEAFDSSKKRILNTLNDSNNKDIGILKGAGHYADNLLEIAKNAKIAIEHGVKMQELDLDTKIIIGKAKSSLSTEAHFNKIDKVIDRMKKSKVGRFVSPAVLSTAVGIAYSVTVGVGGKLLRSEAAAIGSFGAAVVISSAFAGMNESQRIEAERAQHALDRAEGVELPELAEPNSKSKKEKKAFKQSMEKRNNLEKFRYQMESSNTLSGRLRSLMFEKDKKGKDIAREIKNEDISAILASLADIEARHSLNSEKKIDLISYKSIGDVEKESTDLDILVARAKLGLIKKLGKENFNSLLKEQTGVMRDSLLGGEKGIDKKDKEFKKYKRWEVSKKVMKTMAVGLAVGATVQEGLAFFQDDVQGLAEGVFHHDAHILRQTPLDNVFDWATGHPTHMGMGNAIDLNLDGNNFRIPEGTSMIENSDGTYNLLRGDTVISDHIRLDFDADGYLDDESVKLLGENGIVATEDCNMIEGTTQAHSTAEDYIKNHPGSTTHISHEGWYDNDTSAFDNNELELHLGGVNGTGIDTNGNYVFNISDMTDDGSFHEQFSTEAQEKIRNGGLKMTFSLTEGTQNYVFQVPVDIDGNIIIDKDSEIAKLMLGVKDGQLDFHGKFGEIVESFGVKDGVEQVKTLSTIVGSGNDLIENAIPACIESPVTVIDFPVDTDAPMFIPIIARNPLETLSPEKNKEQEIKDKNEIEKAKIESKDSEEKAKKVLKKKSELIAEKEALTKKEAQKENIDDSIKEQEPEKAKKVLKKKSELIAEKEALTKKEYTAEDLSKIGTEFESEEFIYKINAISTPFFGLFGKRIETEVINKKTGKSYPDKGREKDLQKLFIDKKIKINNVLEKK